MYECKINKLLIDLILMESKGAVIVKLGEARAAHNAVCETCIRTREAEELAMQAYERGL